jgi:hypothetical protein
MFAVLTHKSEWRSFPRLWPLNFFAAGCTGCFFLSLIATYNAGGNMYLHHLMSLNEGHGRPFEVLPGGFVPKTKTSKPIKKEKTNE